MNNDYAKPIDVSMTFTQRADSCSDYQPFDPVQDTPGAHALRITTRDAGGGPYLIISTPYWAIDPKDIDTFADTLRRVLDGVKGA